MGEALKYLRELLEKIGIELDKRTATSLLILLLLIILLPIGLTLIKKQLTFLPKAVGELIQLGEGGCIKLNPSNKKVVDCPTVPLKLINPVSAGTPLPSGSTPVSSAPSSSPSPVGSQGTGTPQSVNVKSFNNDIQQALDSIKSSGGSVYLPAGTYTVNKKIRLYSNTTLFGDGIDQTIIDSGIGIDEGESVVGNDTSEGQNNIVIRDMTLKGHTLGSGEGIKLRNLHGGFIHNVKIERFNTGILLGFHSGKGVNNVRISNCHVLSSKNHGIFISLGENNVIDNCNVDSGGSDALGIGLEIAVDGKISGNRVISNTVSNGGHSLTFTSGNDTQSDPAWINSNNIVCYNNASGNHIQPIWDQRGSGNVYVGNNVNVNNVNSFGFEEKGGTDQRCDIPAAYNIPAVPQKPSAARNSLWAGLVKTVFAQDSDDVFSNSSNSDSDDQFTNTGSDSDDQFGTGGQVQYKLAQSQADLTSAQYKNFGNASFLNTTFQLSDSKPGVRQIWVQFLLPDGTLRIDNITFDFVDNAPQILGLSCNLDISKENLKITIDGQNFGTAVGSAGVVSPSKQIEVLGWNDTQISGLLKKPNIPLEEGQRFKVELTRADGFKSGVAVCAVDKSLVSLGARIFCREPGKFDAKDVSVTLFFDSSTSGSGGKLSKIEEKVTIGAQGEISNLKTKLQVDKNYVLSIKAPNSLRRNAVFTAREGTTEISNTDGTPFILPIGDIAPTINPDGQINTLDRSEIIRQWRILGQGEGKQTGDFNRDSKVNSIDWACMRYDFGSSDEPLPVEVPQSASGTIHIPGGQTASPTPNNSARIDSGASP